MSEKKLNSDILQTSISLAEEPIFGIVERTVEMVELKLKKLKIDVTRVSFNKRKTNMYVTLRIPEEVFRNI